MALVTRHQTRLDEYLNGIPNQDLFEEDVAGLTNEQKRSIALSGLYDCPVEWAILKDGEPLPLLRTADLLVDRGAPEEPAPENATATSDLPLPEATLVDPDELAKIPVEHSVVETIVISQEPSGE